MARFEKGRSGNPSGRPKGATNKAAAKVKALIEDLLTENEPDIRKQFKALKGKDKIRAATELLPYVVPKLASTTNTINFDDLSDEQLDEIIERLKGDDE